MLLKFRPARKPVRSREHSLSTGQRKLHDKARLIAVTGYGADEDRRRSREAGFHAHLTKPVDPEVLQSVLLNQAPA